MSTLCLQQVDIKTILDEIKTHKPESKKAPKLTLCLKILLEEMVGVTGIEPVTPSMSTKCSPAELHPHTIFIWSTDQTSINNHVDAAVLPTGEPFTRQRCPPAISAPTGRSYQAFFQPILVWYCKTCYQITANAKAAQNLAIVAITITS